MTITYDSALEKEDKPSMELKDYGTLTLEIFKTLNILNAMYMQDFFTHVPHPQGNQII